MIKKFNLILVVCLFHNVHILATLKQEIGNLSRKLNTLANMLSAKEEIIPPVVIPPRKEEDILHPRNVLKTAGMITQLQVEDNIENAQAFSGYVSVYYAFSELVLELNKKVITHSLSEFMQLLAIRSIMKRRIMIACRNYIANILTNPPYLVAENNLPTSRLGFGLTQERARNIYHSLLNDLSDLQAENYVKNKYTESSSVQNDSLITSKSLLKGITLKTDFSDIIKKRREYYMNELKVSSNALSAYINQPSYFKDYARITDKTEIEFNSVDVLTELHKENSFGLEEGLGGDAMPQGIWLQRADIEHLIKNKSILESVGLTEVENVFDMITIFDDLSLLNMSEVEIADQGIQRQSKYKINEQILQTVAASRKRNIHIFIVNAGFDYTRVNAPNQFQWMVIVRHPDGTYIIADAQNIDRTDNVNVKIIQKAFDDK